MSTLRVGYIGIGLMGSGIVKNLRKADIPVSFTVHRNRAHVAAVTEAGAEEVPDYQTLSQKSDVVLLTVPDSAAVESILLCQDGLGPHLRVGQIVVDMSTSLPSSTRRIGEVLRAKGVAFMDAPLTGSRPQAEDGTLSLICGGEMETLTAVKPIFEHFSSYIFHVGPLGSGHTIKLVNNFLGLGAFSLICEILPLVERCGIDLQTLFNVISVSGGNSKAFQGLVPRVIKGDFAVTFEQRNARKDLRYVTTLAAEYGIPLPVGSAALSVFDMAVAHGYGEKDCSALYQFWKEMSCE